MSKSARLLFFAAILMPILAFVAERITGPDLGTDSSLFRYIGWRMATGGELYKAIWDNKGPVLFLPQYLGYLIFPFSAFGPSLIIMVLWIGTALLYRKAATRITKNETTAALATFFLVLFAGGMSGFANQDCQEATALFFVVAGICSDFLLSPPIGKPLLGICVALVFLIKPNLVSFGGACVIAWGYDAIVKRNWQPFVRSALWSFAGFALTLLLITGYFAASGRAFSLWDATFLFGFFEYGNRDVGIIDFWLHWLSRRLEDPFGGNHDIWQLPMFIGLLIISTLGTIKIWRTGRRDIAVFLGTWVWSEFAMALLMRQFFEHYLIMTCPVVALLSVSFARMHLCHVRHAKAAGTAIIAFVSIWYLTYSTGMFYAVRRNNTTGNWQAELSKWADTNIGEQPIAIIGGIGSAGILDLLKIKTPQKYCAVFMNHRFAKSDWRKQEMADDLLSALKSQAIRWMFCERSIAEVSKEFSECPEIAEQLKHWQKAYTTPYGDFYTKSNRTN